jgi:hypothetical protein
MALEPRGAALIRSVASCYIETCFNTLLCLLFACLMLNLSVSTVFKRVVNGKEELMFFDFDFISLGNCCFDFYRGDKDCDRFLEITRVLVNLDANHQTNAIVLIYQGYPTTPLMLTAFASVLPIFTAKGLISQYCWQCRDLYHAFRSMLMSETEKTTAVPFTTSLFALLLRMISLFGAFEFTLFDLQSRITLAPYSLTFHPLHHSRSLFSLIRGFLENVD